MARERWRSHRTEHRSELRALRLQANEYERRLEDLNHENARILLAQETYLRQDVYNSAHKELSLRTDTLVKELLQRLDAQVEIAVAARNTLSKRVSDLEIANKELTLLTEERKNITNINLADRNRRTTITMWLIGIVVTMVSISVSVALHFIR